MLKTTLKALLMIIALCSLTAEVTPVKVVPNQGLITVLSSREVELSFLDGLEQRNPENTNTQVVFGLTKKKVDSSPPSVAKVSPSLSIDDKRAIMNLMIESEVNKRLLRMNYVYTAAAVIFVTGICYASSFK